MFHFVSIFISVHFIGCALWQSLVTAAIQILYWPFSWNKREYIRIYCGGQTSWYVDLSNTVSHWMSQPSPFEPIPHMHRIKLDKERSRARVALGTSHHSSWIYNAVPLAFEIVMLLVVGFFFLSFSYVAQWTVNDDSNVYGKWLKWCTPYIYNG